MITVLAKKKKKKKMYVHCAAAETSLPNYSE